MESKNKTKVLLKGMHLAYVNTDLMQRLRRETSIINYVAWIKRMADWYFDIVPETQEDIRALQSVVMERGFSSVGEWVDTVMREELGVWPPSVPRTGDTINVFSDTIIPFARENLAELLEEREADGNPRDFEAWGGIRPLEGLIEMKVKASGDSITIWLRGKGITTCTEHRVDRAISYQQFVSAVTQCTVRCFINEARKQQEEEQDGQNPIANPGSVESGLDRTDALQSGGV